jgi:uncharacterized protein
LLLVLFLFLVLGLVTGFLSGFLGIGGGVVVVPGLMYLFKHQLFYHARLINLAAGTSCAIMVITTLRSLVFRYAEFKPVLWAYKKMVLWLLLGAVGGGVLAHLLHPHIIKLFFSLVLMVVALRLIFPTVHVLRSSFQPKRYLAFFALIIGVVSAMVGIGGSVFMVPLLLECNVSLIQAMAVSVALTASMAPLATLVYILTGLHAVSLPAHTLGYVYWPAVLMVGLGSALAAPWGGRCAQRVPSKWLVKLFALLLSVVSVHLILNY